MKVAILGTGLMGYAIAEKLLENNLTVTVYNRTQQKALPLQKKGAVVAKTPEEAIQSAEVILLLLADADAIGATLLSPESKKFLAGRMVIQMGTIAPAQSREIQDMVETSGAEYMEAPVLGSIPQIKAASLIIMAGATPEQFEHWKPFLQYLGPNPLLIGAVGQGAAIKLALNQLIASLTAAFSLSLGYVLRENVNVDQFMNILRDSALYAPTYDKKLKGMLERNFANPNCPTKHILKDVELCLQEAREDALNTVALEGVKQILEVAVAQGLGDLDYSALYNAVVPAR